MTQKAFTVQPLATRIAAYQRFEDLKRRLADKATIHTILAKEFGVRRTTIYRWLKGISPYGNLGRVEKNPDLFYVIGALLGDGCIYFWRHEYQVWLIGNHEFASKYAMKARRCLSTSAVAYYYKRRNYWFVEVKNHELYFLVKTIRLELNYLNNLINDGDSKRNALGLVEGFFDAESCVKIINDKARTVPKICLDFTNTNEPLLRIVQRLLEETLNIQSTITVQKPKTENRQLCYHLRVYSKNGVRKFLENIQTIKMTDQKSQHTKKWLEKENWRKRPIS